MFNSMISGIVQKNLRLFEYNELPEKTKFDIDDFVCDNKPELIMTAL